MLLSEKKKKVHSTAPAIWIFCEGEEGILNPLPKALSSLCHYLRFLQFGWEPYIWNELWRARVGHFFQPFLSASGLENYKYSEHRNLKTVSLMIFCTLACTILELKGSSDTQCVILFLAMCVTEGFRAGNKKTGKHLFEWVAMRRNWYLYYFSFYIVKKMSDREASSFLQFSHQLEANMKAGSMPCLSQVCIYLYCFV